MAERQRISLNGIFREKEFWLLVLLGILYFHRPLFMRETFYFRDLALHFFFQKQLFADFLKAWELPLWNIYQQGGQPYIAGLSNAPFYPINFLFVLFPVIKAFNLSIVLHLMSYSVFTYLLSRVIGLKPLSSFIAGLVYGFCGYALSLANMGGLLMSMPYVPLLLVFWHLYLLEGKGKWLITTVIAGVLQVFAAAPGISVLSMLFLLGWTLCYPYPHRSLWRRCVSWLLLGICIIGIASVQIFPTLEMVSQSSRGRGLTYSQFTAWSLSPKRLPEFFLPEFLGNINTLYNPEKHYWGMTALDEKGAFILSIYIGALTLALTCWGGLCRRDDPRFPFRARFFLFVLFISSLLLSFGRLLPFFPFLYQTIPLISVFRYPIKFLAAGILPVALLTAYTSEVHFGGASSSSQQVASPAGVKHDKRSSSFSATLVIIFWSIGVLWLIFTMLFLFSRDFVNHFQEFFFRQSGNPFIHRGLGLSLFHGCALWLLGALLYQYRRLKKRWWQHWVLAAILTLDLLVAGKHVNFYAPEEFFSSEPGVLQPIRHEIREGRLYRVPKKKETKIKLQAPTDDLMWLYRWNIDVLNEDTAALFRIPVIFYNDGSYLSQARVTRYKTLIESLAWEKRLPLLSAAGVTLILTADDVSLPGTHRIQEIPNRSNIPAYLYRNETAAKGVEFVSNWKFVDSDDQALKLMLHPAYDPRKYVLLQRSETTLWSRFFEPQSPPNMIEAALTSHECGTSKIDKIRSNNHSAVFSVSNSCDGYVVFSEPYYPGWRVYVDEKPVPVFRANYAFSAIFLKAGEHTVERRYRPVSLLLGIITSALCCGMLFFIVYRHSE